MLSSWQPKNLACAETLQRAGSFLLFALATRCLAESSRNSQADSPGLYIGDTAGQQCADQLDLALQGACNVFVIGACSHKIPSRAEPQATAYEGHHICGYCRFVLAGHAHCSALCALRDCTETERHPQVGHMTLQRRVLEAVDHAVHTMCWASVCLDGLRKARRCAAPHRMNSAQRAACACSHVDEA